jgi:peroxiredoxin Q/BCP
MRRIHLLTALLVTLACPFCLSADEKPPAPAATPATNRVELKVGDKVPMFSGIDDQGHRWDLANNLCQDYVVVYFYPADFTLACTRQAAAFQKDAQALADAGITVIGVSRDSAMIHDLFKKAHGLNLTLLADEQGEIAAKFGVPVRQGKRTVRARDANGKPVLDETGQPLILTRTKTCCRWMFIVSPQGKIVHKTKRCLPAQSSQQVLQLVKSLEENRNP